MKEIIEINNLLRNPYLLIITSKFFLVFCMLFAFCCTSKETQNTGDAASDTPIENDSVVEDTMSDIQFDPTDLEKDADSEQDGAFLDCPAPNDFRVSISVQPNMEEDNFASTGEVTAVEKETDGRLLITIDFSTSGGEPNEIAFWIPIPEGVDVDLYQGDEVEVEYSNSIIFWWPVIDFKILKNEETIVQAGTCTNNCIQESMVILPLSFSLLSERCEPQPDELGCALYERLGYSVSCESMAENEEVFDHGYVHVPCGPGYHIVIGAFDRMVERLEPPCTDLPTSHTQILVIKHGDGIAGSSP